MTPYPKLSAGNPNTRHRFCFRTRQRAWEELELGNRCAAWTEATGGQAGEKVRGRACLGRLVRVYANTATHFRVSAASARSSPN